MKVTGTITAADLTEEDCFYFTVRVDKVLFPRPSITMGEIVKVYTVAVPKSTQP